MEPVAEIPRPEPGDSDTVVSLLETAAVFSAKGDAAEALSWLKRAAASASEGGNDTRTLALARSVSNLSERLRAPGALLGEAAPLGAERRAPGPPPRRSTVPPDPEGEAPEVGSAEAPILLSTRSEKPQPSVRPPPPSSRNASPNGTPAPPSVAASSRVTPAPPSVAPPSPGTRAAPSVAGQTNGAPQAPLRSRPPAKPTLASTAPLVATSTPASPTATPLVAKSTPAGATATPLVAKSTPSVAPASAAPAHKARDPWPLRDAARVSIVKSSTEPGLYYVRVLEDGKRPAEGFEGLLVALDPASTLRP